MVRPGNLRKMFQEDNENDAAERFPKMVEKFGNAKTLYDYQKLRATYTNRKEPNYVEAMLQSRPILYRRLENKVSRLPEELFNDGVDVFMSVYPTSSPKELFNAMDRVEQLKTTPSTTAKDLKKLKYTQSYMAKELGKSRNRKNYEKKRLLFMGQTKYASAVFNSKVILAKRVKERYNRLSEAKKNLVNISGLGKSSSPEQLLKALERMASLNKNGA